MGRSARLFCYLSVLILAAAGVLSGCQSGARIAGVSPDAESSATESVPSLTATMTATITPTYTPPAPPTLIPQSPLATRPGSICRDDLTLVMEHNFAAGSDGSLPVLSPNSPVEKGWRVRNSGTCTWDSAYTLAPVPGPPDWLRSNSPMAVAGSVRPGEMADFWVQGSSPLMPGVYRSEWRLQNGRGDKFGTPLSLSFEVAALPGETPLPDVNLIASPLQVLRGEAATIAWSAQQAKAAYFYTSGQAWREHPVKVVGSTVVAPQRTTTYELRVVKPDDSIETRRITIEVVPFGLPKILSFRFEPNNEIELGQCVDIVWRINGRVNTVTVLRDGVFYWTSLLESGATWDCPSQAGTYRYTLQVVGPGGEVEAGRTLVVRLP